MTQANLPEWAIKIKQLRVKLKLTQREFGRLFDVSQVAVSWWESGINEPPASVFMKIIKALNDD